MKFYKKMNLQTWSDILINHLDISCKFILFQPQKRHPSALIATIYYPKLKFDQLTSAWPTIRACAAASAVCLHNKATWFTHAASSRAHAQSGGGGTSKKCDWWNDASVTQFANIISNWISQLQCILAVLTSQQCTVGYHFLIWIKWNYSYLGNISRHHPQQESKPIHEWHLKLSDDYQRRWVISTKKSIHNQSAWKNSRSRLLLAPCGHHGIVARTVD